MFELIILFFEGDGERKRETRALLCPFYSSGKLFEPFPLFSEYECMKYVLEIWIWCVWLNTRNQFGMIVYTSHGMSLKFLTIDLRRNFASKLWNKFHQSGGGMGSEVEASSDNRKYYEILDIYLNFSFVIWYQREVDGSISCNIKRQFTPTISLRLIHSRNYSKFNTASRN